MKSTITRWKHDFKAKNVQLVCRSSEHEFQQQDRGIQRWGYQNRIRSQTLSYEAEEMWSPVVHPETLNTRFEVSWMKNNMCIHALAHSNVEQNSQLGITSRSLYVVCLTSNINITKIYSSSCICGDWTSSTGLLLPVKQVKKYAEPMTENNKELTERFSLLCKNYFIIMLLESVYMTMPFKNQIKSKQMICTSIYLQPSFRSSCVSAYIWIPLSAQWNVQSQTNEVCFLALGMFKIFLSKTQGARGRVSCPLK